MIKTFTNNATIVRPVFGNLYKLYGSIKAKEWRSAGGKANAAAKIKKKADKSRDLRQFRAMGKGG